MGVSNSDNRNWKEIREERYYLYFLIPVVGSPHLHDLCYTRCCLDGTLPSRVVILRFLPGRSCQAAGWGNQSPGSSSYLPGYNYRTIFLLPPHPQVFPVQLCLLTQNPPLMMLHFSWAGFSSTSIPSHHCVCFFPFFFIKDRSHLSPWPPLPTQKENKSVSFLHPLFSCLCF